MCAAPPDKSLLEQIVITALVCKYLESKFPDQNAKWDLVVKKAQTWIKKNAKNIPGCEGIIVRPLLILTLKTIHLHKS